MFPQAWKRGLGQAILMTPGKPRSKGIMVPESEMGHGRAKMHRPWRS